MVYLGTARKARIVWLTSAISAKPLRTTEGDSAHSAKTGPRCDQSLVAKMRAFSMAKNRMAVPGN